VPKNEKHHVPVKKNEKNIMGQKKPNILSLYNREREKKDGPRTKKDENIFSLT
jgi:hypothetical protein